MEPQLRLVNIGPSPKTCAKCLTPILLPALISACGGNGQQVRHIKQQGTMSSHNMV